MPGIDYQEVLLQLLALWELQLAKLQGRRPRTARQRPARTHRPRRDVTKTQYLDQRIEQAVEPIVGLLDDLDVRFIKITLNERLRIDPHLRQLAERVTRRFPPP
jgi:hypothetical protein